MLHHCCICRDQFRYIQKRCMVGQSVQAGSKIGYILKKNQLSREASPENSPGSSVGRAQGS